MIELRALLPIQNRAIEQMQIMYILSIFFVVAQLFFIQLYAEWTTKMENPNLYQGDIVLDPDENDFLKKNAYASIKGGRWPNDIVPYQFESSLPWESRKNIPKAIAEYQRYTCLRFKKRTNEKTYVRFGTGWGCSSPVGYRAGRNNLISLPIGCHNVGTIIHEIGHTIGLFHEQSRSDRDRYVSILFNNIPAGSQFNFHKATRLDSLGTPYDYLSVMHYGAKAFGGNKITIQTIDPYYQDKIGQRKGFSDIDKKQINLMYCGPPTRPPPPPPCVDKDSGCRNWAKTGYCKTNADYMKTSCCQSCKNGGNGNVSPPKNCYDKSNSCASWAKAGHCRSNPDFMKKDCCKSCSTGSTGTSASCIDKNSSCAMWAKDNQCYYNRDYMKNNCKKSCRLC